MTMNAEHFSECIKQILIKICSDLENGNLNLEKYHLYKFSVDFMLTSEQGVNFMNPCILYGDGNKFTDTPSESPSNSNHQAIEP